MFGYHSTICSRSLLFGRDEEGAALEPVPPELGIVLGRSGGEQMVVEVSSSPTIDAITPTAPVTAPIGPSEAAPSSIAPSSKVDSVNPL